MLALALLSGGAPSILDKSVLAGRILATTQNATASGGAAIPQIPDAFYAEVRGPRSPPYPAASCA